MQTDFRYESYTYEALRAMDIAFKRALRKAIAAGLEHAPMGTYKNPLPPDPVRFSAPMRISGCGSTAALCVELGSAVR